jgi:hypothetical protein
VGLSLIALIGVSLVTPAPDESKWRPFFRTAEEGEAADRIAGGARA